MVSSPEAAQAGDIVVLSVHWGAAQAAVDSIKAGLAGKILVDCTNPVGANLGGSSAAEQIQAWAREYRGQILQSKSAQISGGSSSRWAKSILFVASNSADACKQQKVWRLVTLRWCRCRV